MEYKEYKNIPNALRKYRRIRGLKQKQVAQILGLSSASRISRWENGECLPSLVNAIRLSILCRNMVDGLFGDLMKRLREEILLREQEILKSKDS